jgi:hypothetical protein
LMTFNFFFAHAHVCPILFCLVQSAYWSQPALDSILLWCRLMRR